MLIADAASRRIERIDMNLAVRCGARLTRQADLLPAFVQTDATSDELGQPACRGFRLVESKSNNTERSTPTDEAIHGRSVFFACIHRRQTATLARTHGRHRLRRRRIPQRQSLIESERRSGRSTSAAMKTTAVFVVADDAAAPAVGRSLASSQQQQSKVITTATDITTAEKN